LAAEPDGFDPDKQKWELYHIDEDFTQADDLASANPQKLRELQDLWWAEAARHNVLPLDWRGVEKFNAELMGRPSLTEAARPSTYYPGQVACPTKRPAHSQPIMDADRRGRDPASGAQGVIATHGGSVGGYGLYVREGKPTFRLQLPLARALRGDQPAAIAPGKNQLRIELGLSRARAMNAARAAIVTNDASTARRFAEGTWRRDDPEHDLPQRGAGHRHGHRIARGLHVRPPVRLHRQDREVTIELK
jgi:hypothetical protein